MRRIRYILFVCIITLIALEIFVRIYNPFPSYMVGNDIKLQRNKTTTFSNPARTNGLDTQIVISRNRLGFRGPELPDSPALKIITVGGSTTECVLVTEGKTWTDIIRQRLNSLYAPVWVNNAGLDGQSTYGHLILLKQHILKLKPDVCLFLVGCNDVGRSDLNRHDSTLIRTRPDWKNWLAHKSELFSTALNLYRARKAAKASLLHVRNFSLTGKEPVVLPDAVIDSTLRTDSVTLVNYRWRLLEIIQVCRSNGIAPVFITQPCLVGEGVDPLTGVDLSTFRVKDDVNGNMLWKRLELYNQVTRSVAAANHVPLIELATVMPKSTRYFYDLWHYNNEGCRYVAQTVEAALLPYLKTHFTQRR